MGHLKTNMQKNAIFVYKKCILKIKLKIRNTVPRKLIVFFYE
jgi:hypothetical protein